MKTLALLLGCAALLLLLSGCETQKPAAQPSGPQIPQPAVRAGNYTLSGPYLHENLAIFLIHGADQIKDKTYLTLQEALEQKKVIVHETGNVQELAIENLSDEEVYVQSGDIVKGGRQDRVIAHDFIVPAKSGKLPIASFCVESGRWQQRGGEVSFAFANSDSQVASRELKLAANYSGSQTAVWNKVAESQHKLSTNVGAPVASPVSPSSMQLALENTKVKENTEPYTKALAQVSDGKPDAIGYAFAINGKFNTADVYVSHALFMKLWPKLLKASAVEAVAELQKGQKFEAPKPETVSAAMQEAQEGKKSEQAVGPRVHMQTRDAKENVLFETLDTKADAAVRRNWNAKQ